MCVARSSANARVAPIADGAKLVDTFTSCCPKQADYAAACVGAAPKRRHAPGDADDRTRGTLDALDGVELPHTGEPLELSRPAIAERDP